MPLRLHSIDRQFAHFCRTGDAEALGRVFDAAAAELLRVAAWLSGNRADAEDLLQRTFLTAIEDRAAFATERRVMPWLMVILTNHARNLRRERARRAALPARREPTADPVAAANDAEFAAWLSSAHAAIGAPYAEVLALHLEQGLNAKEIAARLHRPGGTVRTQLTRGLERLRQRLPEGFVSVHVALRPEPAALAAIKATVLEAARQAALASAAALATGGMVMPKKILIVLAAILVLLFGVSFQQGWLDASAVPSPAVAVEAPAPRETGPQSATAMATPSHTEAPTPAEPASDAVDSRDVSVLDQRAPLLVRLDGSSAVFPIAKAMAKEFEEAKKGAIKVIVDKSDTDGRRFARGETDISNDSQPISKWRMNACLEGGVEYIELPICFDVLTVAVNPKNDWVSSITVEELDKIWHEKLWEPDRQGKITRWNQVRPEWPAEDLVLFGAAPASAATDYFAEAICRILSRRNFIASESDSVLVHGIEGNKYAIGYIRYGYYEQRKDHIRALAIEWSENSVRTPVMPSIENVQKGIYKPLSRLLCLYVNRKSSERREVAEFIEFFLDHAANLTRELGYLPLPEQVYQNLKQRVAQQQCGTAFGGVAEVALTIDAMLRRSLVSVPAQQK